tara:strand:+ start:46 stop:702 length:657 start_codon:yes stop_codon:yes gene_type:complete
LFEAVLHVNVPKCWLRSCKIKFPEVDINILDIKPLKNNFIEELFELKTDYDNTAEILDYIKNLVGDIDVFESNSKKIYGIIKCTQTKDCKPLLDSTCFLINDKCVSDNSNEWKIRGGGESFVKLTEYLDNENVTYNIKSLHSYSKKNTIRENLSKKQNIVLRYAVENGYFDYPKNIRLDAIAKEFKTSAASVCEMLRKAQKKAILEYYRNNWQSNQLS